MDPIELSLSDDARAKCVAKELEGFCITSDQLVRLRTTFEQELEEGLKGGLDKSCLQMENTYVPSLTNGTEEGLYLALDLGGTNFRVMMMQMVGGKVTKELVAYYSVQEETRLGPGDKLFDFLAHCIGDFVAKHGLDNTKDHPLPLGFTFSFPMIQSGLNVGVLVAWTKSFNATGVIGQDAVGMLNEAIKRKGGLHVKVVAILNDATGTLVKGAYDDPATGIGLILGTGCNGAYLEPAAKVVHWEGDRHGATEVVIDPEFGAFGDNGCVDFLKTPEDLELDKQSLLPKSFTYEKYFAGKYIGELARLVMTRLTKKGLLFQGLSPRNLFQANSFTSANLSDLISGKDATKTIQESLGIQDPIPQDDLTVLLYICQVLSERCALLVAVPMAVFIARMKPERVAQKGVAIAVTGSLYKHHPTIKPLLEKYIGKLSKPGTKMYTFLSDDGSGKGAGLVAAIADRLNKE